MTLPSEYTARYRKITEKDEILMQRLDIGDCAVMVKHEHLKELLDAHDECEKLRYQLNGVHEMLRIECEATGASNDWPDDLHLADVLEKHLMRPVHHFMEGLEAENKKLRAERDSANARAERLKDALLIARKYVEADVHMLNAMQRHQVLPPVEPEQIYLCDLDLSKIDELLAAESCGAEGAGE